MRHNWKRMVLATLLAVTGTAGAWSLETARGADYTPVTFSQLEENNSDGTSHWTDLHPTNTPYPVQFVGVVANNPADMLDTSSQFQVYVQALSSGGTYGGYTVASGDFGGAALYMRKQIPWNASQNYTDGEWAAELARVGASTLRTGDVVLVQAKAPGLFYNGKYNINEQHTKSSDHDFSITVLGKAEAKASSISLSALKDASDHFLFDHTRATGCEHYQGSLVHLDNLVLTDPSKWGLGNTVTVSQGGLTIPMLLGLDNALLSVNPGSNPFSATAILDQESGDLQAGYRLWLTNASMVPEPTGVALLATTGGMALILGWRRVVGRRTRSC